MIHPSIRMASVARLRTGLLAADEPGSGAGGAKARARQAAAKVAGPLVGRLRQQVLDALRPDIDALRQDNVALRADLDRARAEAAAEIELLRAELEGRSEASG